LAKEDNYLRWLAGETPTSWWHDSGDPDELQQGLAHGATGVTTNPVLAAKTLQARPDVWAPLLKGLGKDIEPSQQAEALMRGVVKNAAEMFHPTYERTAGKQGYVCAQVNPAKAADREVMINMARRFHAWAPNIAVKLPVTAAGLDVLEDCIAEGITITATVSFTVAQVIAVAERYQCGLARARRNGKPPGRCFAVIMIGRLDDYLRDVIRDNRAEVSESDIRQAGLAVTKRAYAMYKKRAYEAVLIVAALRGTYHVTELAGAELIMSIHPKHQALLHEPGLPREGRIETPIPPETIRRLETMPEFVRAYEPDGMAPEDFITFGLTQRTLTQFSEAGWLQLESFDAS